MQPDSITYSHKQNWLKTLTLSAVVVITATLTSDTMTMSSVHILFGYLDFCLGEGLVNGHKGHLAEFDQINIF